MTRHHHLPCKTPGHLCTAWWDRDRQSFSAVVTDDNPDIEAENVVLWVGGRPRECLRLDDLAHKLEPFADLPGDVRAELAHDRETAPTQTHLDQELLAILGNGRAR